MGFANIYAEKLDFFMELLINFLDTHGTLDEGRSGKAPEHQGNRLLAAEILQCDRFFSGYIWEGEIRGEITSFWRQFVQGSLLFHHFAAVLKNKFYVIKKFCDNGHEFLLAESFPGQDSPSWNSLAQLCLVFPNQYDSIDFDVIGMGELSYQLHTCWS